MAAAYKRVGVRLGEGSEHLLDELVRVRDRVGVGLGIGLGWGLGAGLGLGRTLGLTCSGALRTDLALPPLPP